MQRLLLTTTLILVHFLLPNYYFGQQNFNRVELQKNLEEYLIKEFQATYYKTIELGQLKPFDYKEIVAEYSQPVVRRQTKVDFSLVGVSC